jgi:divalent metal cation (Fe/Co/Zn/Cd) transporter
VSVRPPNHRHARWLRIGWWCTAFSLAWNLAECGVSVWAGKTANSVALVGFGLNSAVEMLSAAVVAWRLWAERHADPARAARVERTSRRWMGSLLGVLAAGILFEGTRRLVGDGSDARPSPIGMAVTGVTFFVMLALARLKFRVARELGSGAVRADGVQTFACLWLDLATFLGLGLNASLGWSRADPIAGLALVPFIAKESREAWKGHARGCSAAPGVAD